jgi:hypothetical protein
MRAGPSKQNEENGKGLKSCYAELGKGLARQI